MMQDVGSAPDCRCVIDVQEIDELNILQAALKAMEGAVYALPNEKPDFTLIDGTRLPKGFQRELCQTVVKGDTKSTVIAAASILAKVNAKLYSTKQCAAPFDSILYACHDAAAKHCIRKSCQLLTDNIFCDRCRQTQGMFPCADISLVSLVAVACSLLHTLSQFGVCITGDQGQTDDAVS